MRDVGCLIQLRPLDYRTAGDASLWFSVCFFSRKHFLPFLHSHVKEHLTEGKEGLRGYGDCLHCLFDRIFRIILNRKGAKNAKGFLLLVHFDPGRNIQDQNTQSLREKDNILSICRFCQTFFVGYSMSSQDRGSPFCRSRVAFLPITRSRYLGARPLPGRIDRTFSGVNLRVMGDV